MGWIWFRAILGVALVGVGLFLQVKWGGIWVLVGAFVDTGGIILLVDLWLRARDGFG